MNLQRRNVIIGLLACVSVFFTGCVDDKDVYDPNYKLPNPMEELTVPDDFDWKTMNSMDLEVITANETNGNYSVIGVFEANPVGNSDLKPVVTGYAKGGSPFLTTLTIPKTIDYLYIRQTTPEGLISVRFVEITGNKIVCDFSSSGVANRAKKPDAITRADNTEYPDVDPAFFPTSAPDGAQSLDGKWKGTPGNYTLDSDLNNSDKLNLTGNGISNIYVINDVTITFDNAAGRHFYILPGKTLTFTGETSLGQENLIVSVGEKSKFIVTGDISATKTSTIYNKGTVEIKGTGTGNLFSGNVQIHNLPGSSMTLNGNKIQFAGDAKCYNASTFTTQGELQTVGTTLLYNKGIMNVDGMLHTDYQSSVINDGDINCGSYKMTSNSPSIVNNGIMNVIELSQFEGGSTSWNNNGTWITNTMITKAYNDKYINSCKLIVNEKLTFQQARFINRPGSFVKAKDMEIINTRIDMDNESYINVTGTANAKGNRNIDQESEGIYGVGNEKRSLLRIYKLTAATDGQQHLYLSGNLQIACNDYPDQYANGATNKPVWLLANGADWADYESNTVSIPSSNCNEGWAPEEGEPEEPKEVISPYTYSYLFEDMWPLYGDYDMNDIVLRVTNLTTYIDTDNKANKMSFEMSLRAVGAEKRIAGAVMLDKIQASDIKSVTYSAKTPQTFNVSGTGAEANQDNAVIPLFDEAHAFMNPDNPGAWFINTNKNSPQDDVANPPVVTVTIEFSTPVDAADLNAAYLNVFIITDISVGAGVPVNKSGRREIHLVDYQPTKMAGTSVFGNHNDDSSHSSGRYYRSKENLPWGIVIPDSFRWPIEYVMIQNAYGQFVEWVTSGGDANQEWWKNPTNSGNIY